MNWLKKFFISGHPQSIRAKKHIAASLVIKGIGIAVNLALVPLVLRYLGTVKYGIWVTLGSVLVWINFFDIGLGNGLRNKFTKAVAQGDKARAKAYVSTTYFTLSIISVLLVALFLFIKSRIDWRYVFNAPSELSPILEKLISIVVVFFLLQFILKIIGTVLLADQRPAINNSLNVISTIFILVGVFILSKTKIRESLLHVGALYSLMPPLIYLFASFYFFNSRYKKYRPSFSSVNVRYFRDLIGLGGQYFIIHVASVIVFSTNNMIITQILGPEHVTPYNIAFKYFSVVIMFFSIIVQPFWSAYTHAITVGNIVWIKKTIGKLHIVAIVLSGLIIVMLAVSKIVYRLWLGDTLAIPFTLSLAMAGYAILNLFVSPYNVFIMGNGKLRLSVYFVLFTTVINIPLSIWLAKGVGLGSTGVILGSCLSILPGCILLPLQYWKIINNKARGIWNK